MDRISITEFIEEFYTYIKTVKKKFATFLLFFTKIYNCRSFFKVIWQLKHILAPKN